MIKFLRNNKYYRASITVEASIAFSIFIFCISMILGPILIFRTLSKNILYLNYNSKKISIYQMFKYNLNNNIDFIDINRMSEDDYDNKNENTVSENEKRLDIYSNIFNLLNIVDLNYNMKRYDNFNYSIPVNCIYDEDTGIIYLDIISLFKLPINFFNFSDISQRIVINRRAFIGDDGSRYKNIENEFNENDNIYIANDFMNSKIYHNSPSCSYFKKNSTKIKLENINNYKNFYDHDYSKCDYCFKFYTALENNVYITNFGILYHSYDECPRMTGYMTVVSKDYIELYDLKLCSRCSKSIAD